MAPTLPATTNSPLVRTSFTPASSAHWAAAQVILATPNSEGFLPYLSYVDDRTLANMTPTALASASIAVARSGARAHLVAFIADDHTLSDDGAAAEYPVLVVDIDTEREGKEARMFRCVARHLWSPENNLSLANMDWEEFEESLKDGVFYGFGGEPGAGVAEGQPAPPMLLGGPALGLETVDEPTRPATEEEMRSASRPGQ